MTTTELEFPYEKAAAVTEVQNRAHDCVESIAISFEGYDNDGVTGPGLYLAIVSNHSVAPFAEPMGANTWPVETCCKVDGNIDKFYEAAAMVAQSRDGGVCIGVDGTIIEQMVRFKNVRDDELPEEVSVSELEYTDWMGARHMSAYETSLRPEVITTITLSEESGRITIFKDGEYDTTLWEHIGEPWRERDR